MMTFPIAMLLGRQSCWQRGPPPANIRRSLLQGLATTTTITGLLSNPMKPKRYHSPWLRTATALATVGGHAGNNNLVYGALGKTFHHKTTGIFCPSNACAGARKVLISSGYMGNTSSSCSSSSTNNAKQFYHSTTTVENSYQNEFLGMIQKKQPNYQGMDDLFSKILNETKTDMSIFTFVALVKECGRKKDYKAAEAAETIVFKWLIEFYQQGRLDRPPAGNIFGMVLQAWVNTKHPDAGRRANKLLDDMVSLVQQGALPFTPSATIYNTVMKAYAMNGDLENSQLIFDKCMKAFEEGNQIARPDLVSWNTLLDSCAQYRKPDSWKIAEELFNKMQKTHESGILKELPDTICYNSLIKVCAKSNQPQRAQNWLETMYQDFEAGNESAKPNVRSFNTVLDAWANEGTKEAAERCEKIVQRMIKLTKEGPLPVMPNNITYSSVIKAYAKSNQPLKAEHWLQAMFDDYKSGNLSAKPDVTSFSTVLDAWANEGTAESAQRCEYILSQMKKLSKEGTLPVMPNSISYSVVINAHAKSNQPREAEYWLQAMFEDYIGGNSSAKPNVRSFNTVLDAWAREGTVEAAQRCEYVLNHMKKLSDEGTLPVRPNIFSYSSVINAWAGLGNPQKARLVFDNMLEDYRKNGNTSAKPNLVSCRTLLKAFRESGLRDAGEMADALLEEMDELKMVPDADVFFLATHCWQRSLRHCHPKADERIQNLQGIIHGMRTK